MTGVSNIPYLFWESTCPQDIEGIITGCDENGEWLLPWWYQHIRAHASLPITFIDYGMSPRSLEWCEKRGKTKQLSLPSQIFEKRIVTPKRFAHRTNQTLVQEIRIAWFKKPFAMLLSPYKRTLWLDIDCEIKGNISPIFALAENPSGVAIAYSSEETNQMKRKEGMLTNDEKGVNSGVIAYLHGAELIERWALATISYEGDFLGDQDILARVIHAEKKPVGTLSEIYNWRKRTDPHNEAVIFHWWGNAKSALQKIIMSDKFIF
jgi:hypothetical protein